MKAEIIISPNVVLYGQKVSIKLKGFSPEEELTLYATQIDENQKKWSSEATFICNEEGVLDLSHDASIGGSYKGVEPMGMFVYMELEEDETKNAYIKKSLVSSFVDFTVRVKGKVLLTSRVERQIMLPTVIQEKVDVLGLKGTLFMPNDEKNQPIVIFLSGSDGGVPEAGASLLASHGFASLALGYFAHDGLAKNLSKIPLEYFEKAFTFLEKHPNIDARKITLLGGSRGGELALLLASYFPQIKGVIAYVPSHVLWSGLGGHKEMNASSWTFKNKELPFVKVKMPFRSLWQYFFSKKALSFTPTFLNSLKKPVEENSIIAVEKIKGDILLISGEDDQMWCSSLMSTKIMERLKEHDFTYKYEHLNYKGAGHFITIPYYPSTYKEIENPEDNRVYALGGNVVDDLRASEESWAKVLGFLEGKGGE